MDERGRIEQIVGPNARAFILLEYIALAIGFSLGGYVFHGDVVLALAEGAAIAAIDVIVTLATGFSFGGIYWKKGPWPRWNAMGIWMAIGLIVGVVFLGFAFYSIYRGGHVPQTLLLLCMGGAIIFGVMAAFVKKYEKVLRLIFSVLLVFVPFVISLLTPNFFLDMVLYVLGFAWAFFVIQYAYDQFIKKGDPTGAEESQ